MAESMSPIARHAVSPGLYGRACKACATSKAKCMPSNDLVPKCQRCHRLGRSCEQPTPSQRRKSDKKTSRVAKLEEKLESLVTLLNSSTKAPIAESLSTMHTPQSSSSSPSTVEAAHILMSHNPHHVSNLEMRGSSSHVSSHKAALTFAPSVIQDESDFVKEEEMLARFREMAVYFPFFIIPATVDARTLSRERPFLLMAIMANTEQNPTAQRDRVKEIMQYLGLHVFERGEKNLDLLLGVLVHTSWSHYHIHAVPRLTTMLHQALAMLFDLGLYKTTSRNARALTYDERLAVKTEILPPTHTRTLEERRAALGCFVLVSSVANYLQNIPSLKWTPYLEDCLEELQKCDEYDTDSLLINHVRMQQMAEKINSSPWFDGTDQSSGWKTCPPTLYIRALKTELQILKNDFDIKAPHNPTLLSHYHSVEITLYEIGLMKSRLPPTTHPADFNRLEILCSCLESLRNFFDNFLAIPSESYWNLSIVNFTQLGFALNTLQRVSLFEDPTWDLRWVAEKLSFLTVVDQVCLRMEGLGQKMHMVESEAGSECVNIFARTAGRLRKLSAVFEAQVNSAEIATDQMVGLEVGDGVGADMVGFWDQDWFDLMACSWDGV